MDYKRLFYFALALAIGVGLSGCKKNGRDDAPQEYSFAGQTFPSLTAALEEDDWRFTDLTSDEEEPSSPRLHYLYENLSSPSETVEAYLTALTAQHSFYVVDDTGALTDFPDFSLNSGSALMSWFDLEHRHLIRLLLSWEADSCTVELTQPETTSAYAPSSSGAQTPDTSQKDNAYPTAHDAVAFLRALPPSTLELTGDSMSEYNVYISDGLGWIDGVACARLRVYHADPKGFNAYVGSYLLTGDLQHLYRVNPETNEAHALSLP